MFGLVGDANFEIADDSFHQAGISFVPAKHENAAVAMADTYARVTGRPGVATVTRGPGVTNAITGLLEAWKAGTPLLLITGDVEAGVTDDPWHATTFPYTFLRARGARGSIFSQYYLSVGLGLANLVGAAVGADGRCVVSIVGDGGALMSLGEMATIATRTEPILVVVMNDRAYGVELHLAAKHRTSTDLVTFPTTDFAAVARAFGTRAHVVQSVGDLGQIDDWVQRPQGPLLLDCRVNRDVRAPFMEELR